MADKKKPSNDGNGTIIMAWIFIAFLMWAMMMVVSGNIPDSWKTKKRVQNEETPLEGSVDPKILSTGWMSKDNKV